jgi:N-acetylmuramic acid 6-phosphate etherase
MMEKKMHSGPQRRGKTNMLHDADTLPLPPTERRNPRSTELDTMSALEVLTALNDEDATIAAAVRVMLPDLAVLVDRARAAVAAGGRVHYFGAGTSGRLAVLDAAELLPTFNLADGVVSANIAGGAPALVRAVEGSEDSRSEGADAAAEVAAGDVAIGVAASGTTPYVRAALEEARRRGGYAALISSNPGAAADGLDQHIAVDTGPEVLTGSTRLKAGTATKLVLNGFSTALMVRLGYSWSNLMVNVVATNAKLQARSVRILSEATGLPETDAATAMADAGGELKTALVRHLTGASHDAARTALATHGDVVRAAIDAIRTDAAS